MSSAGRHGDGCEAVLTPHRAVLLPSLHRPLCVQIVEILDLMKPESYAKFDDVYVVNELMNTDLHQIIYSSQPLTDEHGE
jgi:hypothetical protein